MAPTLLSLPSKILQVIADHIAADWISANHDHWSLTQSHPRLDSILTPYIKARKNREERSKLLISAIKNSKPPQLCESLLRDGADPRVGVWIEQDKTPLHFAAETGQVVVVRLLLAHKPSLVNIRDGIGRTPLMLAAEGGHEEVVRTLLSRESGPADVTLCDCNDRTALWYAAKGGNVTIVQMLLDTGKLDHNAADDEGVTAFACAASEGHCEVMRFLLSLEGVNPDCRMNRRMGQGKTPLYLAARNGREEAVKYLLTLSQEGRVDPDAKTVHGETPLRVAAWKGHAGVVQQLLVVKGVNPDAANCHQSTPLIVAALRGHLEVVKLLLETGRVQPNARDHQGMTPLMWAVKFQRTPVVELLLSTGQVQVDFDLSELTKESALFRPPWSGLVVPQAPPLFGGPRRLDESLVKLLDDYKAMHN